MTNIRTLLLVLVAMGCQEYGLKGRGDESTTPDDPPQTTDPTVTTPPTTPPEASSPTIRLEPTFVDFGTQPPGCTSPRLDVTIHNDGTADLVVDAVRITNDTANAFRHLGAPVTIPPSGSNAFEVDFTPPDLDPYQAVVEVLSNDPDRAVAEALLQGVGLDHAPFTDAFTQTDASLLDILWVIDNSGSMSGEIDHLANSFDTFIQAFVGSGIDWQIGVVTTDMADPAQSGAIQGPIIHFNDLDPVGAFSAQVSQGTEGSGDERGIDAAYFALTPPLSTGANSGLIRAGSVVTVIVVSDEDDSSFNTPTDLAGLLDGLQGDPALTSFNAIAGPTSGVFPCLAIFSGISADPAPVYWSAVQQTGGVHLSLCNLDMNTMLARLATQAIGLVDRFALSQVPYDPAHITVLVDGVVIDETSTDGWTYDASANAVVFHGAEVPSSAESIDVTYDVFLECP